ncbi:MAG: YlbF family regulator [Paenibacillaceae bacterium]
MSVMEKTALDMAAVLMKAYQLGDMINGSAEVVDYLYWKDFLDQDTEVKALVQQLDRKKELFEECQRFGHYHPDYHKALDGVKQIEHQLEEIESVARYKASEAKLDELLYDISTTIAYAVSDTIKVPSNNPSPSEGGCSAGGSCSGSCG